MRKAYGLDRPLIVQFFAWVGRALVGDFGESYFFKDSVSTLIAERMPITLTLGLIGLAIALVVSMPLGILAAVRENTWIDRGVPVVTMVGQAVPSFWLALILMIVLGLQLGCCRSRAPAPWQHFVMPGIVLAFYGHPGADAADALRHDRGDGARTTSAPRAPRACRARASSSSTRCATPPFPVVSIAAVQLGFMLGGSIVIETVFALHGVGYLGWESIAKNDFPVVQAVVLVLAVIYIGSPCWPTCSTPCSIRGCAAG